MLKNLPQRIIEYPINTEYIDTDGNLWSYRAYVQMTYKYEVRDVIITAIEVESIKGEPIPFRSILTKDIEQTLKDHAAKLALEKVQSVDFYADYEDL